MGDQRNYDVATADTRGTHTANGVCLSAAEVTGGERQRTHGDKVTNHENIARLWSAYLGHPVSAHDVALMMALLKVARTMHGDYNRDDYVDLAGYAGCAAEIRHRTTQQEKQ